jgi:hypothetical protein
VGRINFPTLDTFLPGWQKEPEATKGKLGSKEERKSVFIKIDISAKENRIKDEARPAGLQYGLKGYNRFIKFI